MSKVKIYKIAMLVAASTVSHADTVPLLSNCIAAYEEANAIPFTYQCRGYAAAASSNVLQDFMCTARPEWAGAYCRGETTVVESDCEGEADGT